MSRCSGHATSVLFGGSGCSEEFLANLFHYCSFRLYSDTADYVLLRHKWRSGGGERISDSPIIKRNLYSSADIHTCTTPGPQGHTHLHSLLSSISFSDIRIGKSLKIFVQTQVVSHSVTPQSIRNQDCFLYSRAAEAQHLCCICRKGNQRPVVSLPWQDGSIVSNSTLDCQNSLGQDSGLSCRGFPTETCSRRNVGSISGEAHFNPISPHDLGTHHSPLADTASLRTSLFLSSRGLAKARITCGLYGSSCGIRVNLSLFSQGNRKSCFSDPTTTLESYSFFPPFSLEICYLLIVTM